MNTLSMKVLGLVAVMGLVGCVAESKDDDGATTTKRAAQASTTYQNIFKNMDRVIDLEICEGALQPAIDPFFAEWISATLAQDPTAARIDYGTAQTTSHFRPVQPRTEIDSSAVIAEISFPASDDAGSAKMTLKLTSPDATAGDPSPDGTVTSSDPPIFIPCPATAGIPFPIPVYSYRVVAVDEAGNTAVDTMDAHHVAAMKLTLNADGSRTVNDVAFTLSAKDAAGLAGKVDQRVSARIDKLPGGRAPKEILVVGSKVALSAGFDPAAAATGGGETQTLTVGSPTTSYQVAARLTGLRQVRAGIADSDVVVELHVDGGSSPTVTFPKAVEIRGL